MKYSPAGVLYVAVCFLLTKIFYRKARLIRFPIDVRGAKFINFGNRLTTGYLCRIEAYPDTQATVLHIGDNVQINDFVHIAAKQSVMIGSNVLIASKVFISDINHGSYKGDCNDDAPSSLPVERFESAQPVSICDNVWIGEGVQILAGVTIGAGCVIGAGSVVTKDIPENSIAAGNPAKVIKKYNTELKRWEL